MIFNFNPFEDLQDTCDIVIRLGNTDVQHERIPLAFAPAHLMQYVQQFAKDSRPIQVKCIKKYTTDQGREIDNILIYSNNTYVKEFNQEENDNAN